MLQHTGQLIGSQLIGKPAGGFLAGRDSGAKILLWARTLPKIWLTLSVNKSKLGEVGMAQREQGGFEERKRGPRRRIPSVEWPGSVGRKGTWDSTHRWWTWENRQSKVWGAGGPQRNVRETPALQKRDVFIP